MNAIKKCNFDKLVEGVSFLSILLCVFCSIRMNIVGRSLWLDEAMLAISMNKRSLLTLFSQPLEWNQSAPVGYLFVVKLIIELLGNSEASFPIFSIVAYVGVLVLFYTLTKKIVAVSYPMLCTAGVANIAFLLEYSNMFKPYICDAFCVLLVLLLYYLYREKRIPFWGLCLGYALLLWCSNPVAFFAGGVVVYHVLEQLIQKNKKGVVCGFLLGISICLSFLIMYLVWLKPTIDSTNLSDFWEGYEFPFIIRNQEELDWMLYLIKFVTQGVGATWKIVLCLALVGIIWNLLHIHNPYVYSMTIGSVITLVASHLGFFPMSDRLFLFLIPLLVFLAVFCLKNLIELLIQPRFRKPIFAGCMMVFLLSGTGIRQYHEGIAYRDGEEANDSITYIQEHITQDDMIYVYYPAIPVFQYKMGYDTQSVCGYDNNVYLGHGFFCKDGGSPEDIAYIAKQSGIYLLFSHVVDYEPTDNLMDVLNQSGTLEKINNEYLYYYSCDGSQSKAKLSYQLVSAETKQDICTATIQIANEGDTWLNNGREQFAFHDQKENLDYVGEQASVIDDIAPGQTKEITIQFAWDGRESVSLSLFNVGKYDFSSLYIDPCVITREMTEK